MGVLLLVRHGQASFGTDDYDVLSPTGWEQSRLLGAWLAARGPAPDVVLRGTMRRHRETAEGLLEGSSWSPPVEVDADWDEFDHLGVVDSFPDRPVAELDRRGFQEVFEQATRRWMSGAHDGYPETFAGFQERVRAALGRAASYAGPGGSAVVVTSGGTIAAACAALVDPDTGPGDALTGRLWQRFNTVVVNSAVTRVVVGSTGPRLLSFNEHPHLDGPTLTYR